MRQRLFGLWMVLIGLHAMKISTLPVVDSKPVSVLTTDICILNSLQC